MGYYRQAFTVEEARQAVSKLGHLHDMEDPKVRSASVEDTLTDSEKNCDGDDPTGKFDKFRQTRPHSPARRSIISKDVLRTLFPKWRLLENAGRISVTGIFLLWFHRKGVGGKQL